MIYCGHVKKGRIMLDKPAALPEGAMVRIRVLATRNGTRAPNGTRQQILRMPLDERRRRLLRQSKRLADLYADDLERVMNFQSNLPVGPA